MIHTRLHVQNWNIMPLSSHFQRSQLSDLFFVTPEKGQKSRALWISHFSDCLQILLEREQRYPKLKTYLSFFLLWVEIKDFHLMTIHFSRNSKMGLWCAIYKSLRFSFSYLSFDIDQWFTAMRCWKHQVLRFDPWIL